MARTGDVPRTKSCPWAAVPLRAQLAFPFLPGIPAFARSSALPLAPKLSSPILPEAADLLGAQRLSSYAAGAGVMAAVSEEQPQRPNTQRQAPGRGDQRAAQASRRPSAHRLAPPASPGTAGPGGARPGAHPPHPGLSSRPGLPAGSTTRRGPASVCLGPGAWHPAHRDQGVGGIGIPARHLPSSLSSTIISGAPCPAAVRLGREKGADSGRASAGRPVLRQRAGSNYPLVRLLT